MPVLVVLSLLGALVSLVSYLRSADFRVRRWFRREGIRPYVAYAHAEAAGLRMRAMEPPSLPMLRRLVLFRAGGAYLLVVGITYGMFRGGAPWWLGSLVLTMMVLLQTNPQHTVRDIRGGLSAGNTAGAVLGIGYAVIGVALVFVGVSALWTAMVWSADDVRAIWRWVIAMLVGLVLLAVATQVLIRMKRALAQAQPIRFGRDATEEDVLFLRSFNDDDMRLRSLDPNVGALGVFRGMTTRFEELAAAFAARDAPLIAIGRPGEPLPRLGAARTYVSDDEWQKAVEESAHRVGSIVMVAGTTDGLGWELHHLREWGLAQKLTILLPPVSESEAWNRLHRLLAQLGIDFGQVAEDEDTGLWLGVLLRTATAIGIDDEGQPCFYVMDRRDWMSFGVTMMQAGEYVRGHAMPPEHGMLAEYLGLEVTDVALSRVADGTGIDLRDSLSDDAEAAFARAVGMNAGDDRENPTLSGEQLLVALLDEDNTATSTLAAIGTDVRALRSAAHDLLGAADSPQP